VVIRVYTSRNTSSGCAASTAIWRQSTSSEKGDETEIILLVVVAQSATLSNCGNILKPHLPSKRGNVAYGRVNSPGYGKNGEDKWPSATTNTCGLGNGKGMGKEKKFPVNFRSGHNRQSAAKS